MTGLQFSASLAERGFSASFRLERGRTLAVLGPNGAGKSTLLGLLAGLLTPTSGRATLDGRTLFDVRGARTSISDPRDRGVALLAQEALLFPHLSVLDNVAFGPRSRGRRTRDARSSATAWLEKVGAGDLARRRPSELSGGQAQRVAVARALAAEPSLLLLDEPLAALDVTAAPAVRGVLREVLADRTAVIVTHEPLDALLLADDVLILEAGEIVEAGPVKEVLTRPMTAFGARLAGLNLVPGTFMIEAGEPLFRADNGLVVPFAGHLPEGTPLVLAVRPARLAVSRSAGTEEGWSWIGLRVDDVEQQGESVRVSGEGLAADLPPADLIGLGVVAGERVLLGVRHADAAIYPDVRQPATGRGRSGPDDRVGT